MATKLMEGTPKENEQTLILAKMVMQAQAFRQLRRRLLDLCKEQLAKTTYPMEHFHELQSLRNECWEEAITHTFMVPPSKDKEETRTGVTEGDIFRGTKSKKLLQAYEETVVCIPFCLFACRSNIKNTHSGRLFFRCTQYMKIWVPISKSPIFSIVNRCEKWPKKNYSKK